MFCKHEWELLTETVTKSKFEVAMEAIGERTYEINLPWHMSNTDRKHIQTFTCKKCGKLKRFVEEI